MMKETIRQNGGDVQTARTKVISTIRNMPNRDEAFAILTRNNKMFNKQGIRFSADAGNIQLNGIRVDLQQFGTMGGMQRSQFLIDLPPTPTPSPAQFKKHEGVTITNITAVFNSDRTNTFVKYGLLVCRGTSFANLAATLLEDFSEVIQEKVLKICKSFIDELVSESLDFLNIMKVYFSHINKEACAVVFKIVMDFLKRQINIYETKYQKAKQVAMRSPNFDEEKFNREWGVHPDTGRRAIYWFEKIVNCFVNDGIDHNLLKELIQYFKTLLTEQIMNLIDRDERDQRRLENGNRNTTRVPCPTCGGFYFSK